MKSHPVFNLPYWNVNINHGVIDEGVDYVFNLPYWNVNTGRNQVSKRKDKCF